MKEKIVWQLSSVPMSDETNLKRLLEDSWEPFSTSLFMEPNPLNPREIKQTPIIFLKRGVILEDFEGAENSKSTLALVE